MLLLLTGFEPFGGSAVNPSEQLARRIARKPPPGMLVRARILPVVGAEAVERLVHAIDSVRPDAVVCLGESGRAAGIAIERVAVNLRDYPIPDNAGRTVRDENVVPGAPAAYFSTLPVRLMAEACAAAGVPATLSLSAGTYLCNEVMFALLHLVHARPRLVPAGFLHVPRMPEQVVADVAGDRRSPERPSMDLAVTERGVRAALGVLAAPRRAARTDRRPGPHRRAER